ELAVVEVRVAAQRVQQALHHRENQSLVGLADPTEERLEAGTGPVVGLLVRRIVDDVESSSTEHPALDQVGVNCGGLLDREISLVDRAEATGSVAQLLFQ